GCFYVKDREDLFQVALCVFIELIHDSLLLFLLLLYGLSTYTFAGIDRDFSICRIDFDLRASFLVFLLGTGFGHGFDTCCAFWTAAFGSLFLGTAAATTVAAALRTRSGAVDDWAIFVVKDTDQRWNRSLHQNPSLERLNTVRQNNVD